jgi:hypothetical protein
MGMAMGHPESEAPFRLKDEEYEIPKAAGVTFPFERAYLAHVWGGAS